MKKVRDYLSQRRLIIFGSNFKLKFDVGECIDDQYLDMDVYMSVKKKEEIELWVLRPTPKSMW